MNIIILTKMIYFNPIISLPQLLQDPLKMAKKYISS